MQSFVSVMHTAHCQDTSRVVCCGSGVCACLICLEVKLEQCSCVHVWVPRQQRSPFCGGKGSPNSAACVASKHHPHHTRTMECDQLQSSSSDPRLHVVTCKLIAVEIVTTCINNDMQGKVTAGYITVSNN